MEAYDVRTGDRRWAFRTSEEGSRLRPDPASTYELDGTQYIAVPMGPALWAFALDGTVPARGEPSPGSTGGRSARRSRPARDRRDRDRHLLENPRGAVGGPALCVRKYNFNPICARASARTRARFTTNGEIPHTLAARDGSWSTGTLNRGLWGFVTFDEPGDVPLSLRGPSLDAGGDHPSIRGAVCLRRRFGVPDSRPGSARTEPGRHRQEGDLPPR